MTDREKLLLDISARLKVSLSGYIGDKSSPEVMERVKASILELIPDSTPGVEVTQDPEHSDCLLVSFDEVRHELTVPADVVWESYGPSIETRLTAEGMSAEQAAAEVAARTDKARFHFDSLLAETPTWLTGGPND